MTPNDLFKLQYQHGINVLFCENQIPCWVASYRYRDYENGKPIKPWKMILGHGDTPQEAIEKCYNVMKEYMVV